MLDGRLLRFSSALMAIRAGWWFIAESIERQPAFSGVFRLDLGTRGGHASRGNTCGGSTWMFADESVGGGLYSESPWLSPSR
jgi:hypothetical protein